MMSQSCEFAIENDCDSTISIYVEPEGVVVSLERGEKIVVHDQYESSPVTVRISMDTTGDKVLCIWPGDGSTTVTKNGQDVLDLA